MSDEQRREAGCPAPELCCESRGRDTRMARDERAGALASAATVAPSWAPAVVRRFEEQARRRPDAVAAALGNVPLTYATLDARANRVAERLVTQGLAPDTRVAVCVDRALDVLVAMLGVLKAGSTYVALDPSDPADRLERQIVDNGVALVLTHGASAHAALQRWHDIVLDLTGEWSMHDRPAGPAGRPTSGSFISLSAFALSLGSGAGLPGPAAMSPGTGEPDESLQGLTGRDGALAALAAAVGIDLAACPPITFTAVGPPAQR